MKPKKNFETKQSSQKLKNQNPRSRNTVIFEGAAKKKSRRCLSANVHLRSRSKAVQTLARGSRVIASSRAINIRPRHAFFSLVTRDLYWPVFRGSVCPGRLCKSPEKNTPWIILSFLMGFIIPTSVSLASWPRSDVALPE